MNVRLEVLIGGSILLLRWSKHGAHAGADGSADVERRGGAWIGDLQALGRFAQQLERAPADHGNPSGADGVTFRDEAARGVDGAFAIGSGLAFDPIAGAL